MKKAAEQFFKALQDTEDSKRVTRTNAPKKVIHEDLSELYTKPRVFRDENEAKFQVFRPNIVHQCDLMMMPSDHGYRYILVVVDVHNKKCDAQELKTKDSDVVLRGILKIYNRKKHKVLEQPETIECDAGNEFKGEFKQYFKDQGVRIRTSLTGRHKQTALVETKNHYISHTLNKQMGNKEMLNGKENKEWVVNLPLLIRIINENLPPPTMEAVEDDVIETKYNHIIYPEGTKVRVMLDHPESIVDGKRLYGDKFRSGDIRWSRKVYEIVQIILKTGYPPMYIVSDHKNIARAKYELLKVRN